MFTLLCAISIQNLKVFCKDKRLLFYISRTLHLFGTDWCAMMVPIRRYSHVTQFLGQLLGSPGTNVLKFNIH